MLKGLRLCGLVIAGGGGWATPHDGTQNSASRRVWNDQKTECAKASLRPCCCLWNLPQQHSGSFVHSKFKGFVDSTTEEGSQWAKSLSRSLAVLYLLLPPRCSSYVPTYPSVPSCSHAVEPSQVEKFSLSLSCFASSSFFLYHRWNTARRISQRWRWGRSSYECKKQSNHRFLTESLHLVASLENYEKSLSQLMSSIIDSSSIIRRKRKSSSIATAKGMTK